MVKRVIGKLIFLTVLMFFLSFQAYGDENLPEFFTIIILPDTQIYAESYPDTFYAQTKWIKDNAGKLNLQFVIHMGDITNRNSEKEWEVANKAYANIRGVTRYCVIRGNHDMGPGGNALNRESEGFKHTFSPQHIEKETWFGGKMGDDLSNAWYKFDVKGIDFIIIALDFYPTDEALEWAGKILENNRERNVILVTHAYLNADGSGIKGGQYGCGGNDGETVWEKLVSQYSNIFMVLCGHVVPSAQKTVEREDGSKVHQIISNYQNLPEGGQGWLRIMKFHIAEGKISVDSYSPDLDSYRQDGFEIEWQPAILEESKPDALN